MGSKVTLGMADLVCLWPDWGIFEAQLKIFVSL
jgi:hypothetical protein